VAGAIYFLPSFMARNKSSFSNVLLINLFLGWTIIGWIVALSRATSSPIKPESRTSSEATQLKLLERRVQDSIARSSVPPSHASRAAELAAFGLSDLRAKVLAGMVAGPYSLILKGVKSQHWRFQICWLLTTLGYSDSPRILERAIHISPEAVAVGVSEEAAIALKKQFETYGAQVEIRRDGTPRVGRPSISVEVRREVWNRDAGQCVDCGSREFLEYDHIIPISKGGSNTPRNLELRCERCNRSKGASI
jgi:hypothetical protein